MMCNYHRYNAAGEKIVAFLPTNIICGILLVYNLHQSLKFLSFDVSGKIIYGSYELTTTDGFLLISKDDGGVGISDTNREIIYDNIRDSIIDIATAELGHYH